MHSWLLPWPDLRDGALQRSVPLRNRDTDWRRGRLGHFDDRSRCERLYLSHATKVVVVDLNTNSVTGEIADTPGVHAFVAVSEVRRGFSSNGKESKSSVVDLTTLKTTSKIDTGENPDAVVYEPRHGEVYIFNHPEIRSRNQSKTATVFSDDSARRNSRIRGGRSSSRARLLQHRRQERSCGDRCEQT